MTHLLLLKPPRGPESIPAGHMPTPEDPTMLFLFTPTVCEVISGKILQQARYSTYRASVARYFAGRYLGLQASESESVYWACWRMPVWWYFMPLLILKLTSAAERGSDTVIGFSHRLDCQPVVGLVVLSAVGHAWPLFYRLTS